MPRLPIPGSDDGKWGDLLNEFLAVELNNNGSLKKAAQIQAAQQTANDAQAAVAAKADDSAVIHNSIITTKGGLIAGTGSATVTQIPAGSNNQVLTADSTQTSGIKWAPVTAPPASLVWQALTLNANTSDFGPPYAPCSAAIDNFGVVHLRGIMTMVNFASAGVVLATLPQPAMSPAYRKLFWVVDANNPTSGVLLAVQTDGTITATAPMNSGFLATLDNTTFETQA